MNSQYRQAEVMTIQGFKEISFRELKKGDIFRLYTTEHDGEQVYVTWENDGKSLDFTAETDAFLNPEGVWEISCYPKEWAQ